MYLKLKTYEVQAQREGLQDVFRRRDRSQGETFRCRSAQIKKLVADYEGTKEKPADEEAYVPETSLLQILEQGNKELFDKFWWDTIYPRGFIEMLINGIENGYIEKYDEDDFDYENEYDFLDICDMYSDDIHIEHPSSCICRIPEEWRSKKKTKTD